MTDASLYNGEGEIIGFEPKAYIIGAWHGAMSGRGNMWGPVTAAARAESYASFDDFVANSGPEIKAAHRQAQAAGELPANGLISLHVIGWSDTRDEACAFSLVSESRLSDDDKPAYTWGEVSEWSLGPGLSEVDLWHLHRQGIEPIHDYDLADFDPVKHGLPIMEAQRRQKTDPRFFAGEPFHCVGGSAWATEVTREGVTQRVIHEWGDEVGEPIRPAAFDSSALPLAAPGGFPAELGRQWVEFYRTGRIDPVTLKVRPAGAAVPMGRQQRRVAKRRAA
jgi:hypothetical protein